MSQVSDEKGCLYCVKTVLSPSLCLLIEANDSQVLLFNNYHKNMKECDQPFSEVLYPKKMYSLKPHGFLV